jgi:hypothetical protein
VPRRHIKKDDRTTLCGVSLTPRFQKNLAPDRQHVTCGACELVSRPKVEKPKQVEIPVEAFASVAAPDADAGAQAPRAHIEGAHDTRAND